MHGRRMAREEWHKRYQQKYRTRNSSNDHFSTLHRCKIGTGNLIMTNANTRIGVVRGDGQVQVAGGNR